MPLRQADNGCEKRLDAMTSFQAYANGGPASVLVLAAGLLGLMALYGLGRTFLALTRVRLPRPWETALALVSGVLALASLSLCLSLFEGGIGAALLPAWLAAACGGIAWSLPRVASAWRRRTRLGSFERAGAIAWVTAAAVCLLIALAPSTKIDELYYHMLVPSRAVSDGVLRYYAAPWESAVTPQMCYQLAAIAPHAAGFPDAPNVVSWGLAICLSSIVWWEIRRLRRRRWLSTWIPAAMWVGLYPAVWWVTGGPGAFGDLSVTGAILVLGFRRRFVRYTGGPGHVLVVAVLATAAAGAKISNAPLAAAAVIAAAFLAFRQGDTRSRAAVLGAALLPGLLFVVPLAAWAFMTSGSPLGPVFAGWFGPSLFGPGEMSQIRRETIAANTPSLGLFVRNLLASWSPPVILGSIVPVFAAFAGNRLARIVSVALLLQVLVIGVLLQPDPRFLSGIPYAGLVASAVLLAKSESIGHVVDRFRWVAALVVLPFLGLLVFYSVQFLRPSLELQSKESFLQEKTAFRDDFVRLDRVLPRDGVLFITRSRADSVYAPRPVIYDLRDWPANRSVFLYDATGQDEPRVPAGTRAGQLVYENPAAIGMVFRTPGLEAQRVRLRVWELRRSSRASAHPLAQSAGAQGPG